MQFQDPSEGPSLSMLISLALTYGFAESILSQVIKRR